MDKKKVILIIRDGWGHSEKNEDNFLLPKHAPVNAQLLQKYPNTLLEAAGPAVGLPKGCQGNSEVGHMTIGAGRIIFQSLERINRSIGDGKFFKIPEFIKAIKNCKKNKSALHIMGLIQTEGVHAHIDHLFALLELCKKQKFKNVYIHAFTDGRDAPIKSSANNLKLIKEKIAELGFGKIATISGRYYAMDRDKRWDRTKEAYDCIIEGRGKEYSDPQQKMEESYLKDETDEFIRPSRLAGYGGVKNKDSIIFFNFRTDRVRQLSQAIANKKFEGWKRQPLDVYFVLMTQAPDVKTKVAFKEVNLKNLLGEMVSKKGLKQFRVSETEKYAHVTFFFNGQKDKPFKGEKRVLIPSPNVATYDFAPEMSAEKITGEIEGAINKKYDFIVTNLVNCDMVGHTGKKDAILKAVKTVDDCVGKIVSAGLRAGYVVMVTADHGNAEDKSFETGTSHTKNKVPFILVSEEIKGALLDNEGLSSIAPTILALMGIKKPKEMTGNSLLINLQ